jgi:hypothetical protein
MPFNNGSAWIGRHLTFLHRHDLVPCVAGAINVSIDFRQVYYQTECGWVKT